MDRHRQRQARLRSEADIRTGDDKSSPRIAWRAAVGLELRLDERAERYEPLSRLFQQTVRLRDRLDTALDLGGEDRRIGVGPERLPDDGRDDLQDVLDPVIQLTEQERPLCLGGLSLADVSSDHGGAGDAAFALHDG